MFREKTKRNIFVNNPRAGVIMLPMYHTNGVESLAASSVLQNSRLKGQCPISYGLGNIWWMRIKIAT